MNSINYEFITSLMKIVLSFFFMKDNIFIFFGTDVMKTLQKNFDITKLFLIPLKKKILELGF